MIDIKSRFDYEIQFRNYFDPVDKTIVYIPDIDSITITDFSTVLNLTYTKKTVPRRIWGYYTLWGALPLWTIGYFSGLGYTDIYLAFVSMHNG